MLMGMPNSRLSPFFISGVVGAAPVAKETMDFFDSLERPLYEIYGMTENFAYVVTLIVFLRFSRLAS